jgi:hypothetical protein
MFPSQANFIPYYAVNFLEKPHRSRKIQNRMQENTQIKPLPVAEKDKDCLLRRSRIRAKSKLFIVEYLLCDVGLTVFNNIARTLIN